MCRRIALAALAALVCAPVAAAAGPTLGGISVSNGSTPFAGDGPLFATVSPNGDAFRDTATVRFTLDEPATVTLEVDRTTDVPVPVTTVTQQFPAGPGSLSWTPGPKIRPRTFLLRLIAVDAAGNRTVVGSPTARVDLAPRAPVVRVQGIDAGFSRPSYVAGQRALLTIATDAPSLELQFFRSGPEKQQTYGDSLMDGIPVTQPVMLDWRRYGSVARTIAVGVPGDPTGFYFARLTAPDGRFGYAPFVLRPNALGEHRVAVVLPTLTWQAYDFQDENGDGWGDTWYAGPPNRSVRLGKIFTHRGAPPFFYRYDLGFLRWLAQTGKQVDYLADLDLDTVSGDELAKEYDLVVFPGHSEYVTDGIRDAVERYRDLGGNLIFLSSNSFFWRVALKNGMITRTAQWRAIGRPEAALLGTQYVASDRGRTRGLYVVRSAAMLPWLWAGTGLADGATFGSAVGGYGIEIDATTPASPPGTAVVADIPHAVGGKTAQMSEYELRNGAKVFSAGTMGFGGSALTSPVSQLLENLWARFSQP